MARTKVRAVCLPLFFSTITDGYINKQSGPRVVPGKSQPCVDFEPLTLSQSPVCAFDWSNLVPSNIVVSADSLECHPNLNESLHRRTLPEPSLHLLIVLTRLSIVCLRTSCSKYGSSSSSVTMNFQKSYFSSASRGILCR